MVLDRIEAAHRWRWVHWARRRGSRQHSFLPGLFPQLLLPRGLLCSPCFRFSALLFFAFGLPLSLGGGLSRDLHDPFLGVRSTLLDGRLLGRLARSLACFAFSLLACRFGCASSGLALSLLFRFALRLLSSGELRRTNGCNTRTLDAFSPVSLVFN